MADFIEMNHADMLRQIAELDKTLAGLEKSVSGEIMDIVLHEAAEQLKDEQARILSGAPSDGIRSLAKDLLSGRTPDDLHRVKSHIVPGTPMIK